MWYVCELYSSLIICKYGGIAYCWSKDSRFIFFCADQNLYRVDVQGDVPQKLPSIKDAPYSPVASHSKLVFCSEGSNQMSIFTISFWYLISS
jgi:hypothetical protein